MATQRKFTEGPWEAVVDGDPRGQPSSMYRGLIALVERGDRTLAVVLGVGHRYENVPQEQWKPNARLIAAAPEMFEALSIFLDCFDRGLISLPKTGLEIARAALAKAEGRDG